MPGFRVDEILKDHPEDREAFEQHARDLGRTIDECHDWLQTRGYVISRSAVGTWKQWFDGQLMAERMTGSGKLAKAFLDAAKSGDGLSIPDAAVLQISQLIFEAGARASAGGDVKTDELKDMSLALQRLMLAKARLEATRSEFIQRQKAAIAEAEKTVKTGATGEQVVNRMRELLGL